MLNAKFMGMVYETIAPGDVGRAGRAQRRSAAGRTTYRTSVATRPLWGRAGRLVRRYRLARSKGQVPPSSRRRAEPGTNLIQIGIRYVFAGQRVQSKSGWGLPIRSSERPVTSARELLNKPVVLPRVSSMSNARVPSRSPDVRRYSTSVTSTDGVRLVLGPSDQIVPADGPANTYVVLRTRPVCSNRNSQFRPPVGLSTSRHSDPSPDSR